MYGPKKMDKNNKNIRKRVGCLFIIICNLQVQNWYNEFKRNYPELWKISEGAMKEIQHFAANPPDLTHLNHPIHPARKSK